MEKQPNVVFLTNKKSGTIYAYEDHPYWDSTKQQSRSKRKCLGKVDQTTGEIVPTRGRKVGPSDKLAECIRKFYGTTYLLDAIGDKIGITADLKECFPDAYKQILSLAYYLVMEDKNPLYRFEKWGLLHNHPYNKDISSQRSTEIFESISQEAKSRFFKLQSKRRIEKECWAYDTTTISSYSESLRQVQFGLNKEDDKLPQLKLLLLFGEQSGLPFYYRKLAGNTPDSKTVRNLLAEIDLLELNKVKLVMDRGFYSESNINSLYKSHIKFLIGCKTSLVFVRNALNGAYDKVRSFENYSPNHDVYMYSVTSQWDKTPNKRRIYIHLYYNIGKACENERKMDIMLSGEREKILSGELTESKYFDIQKTPKRGIKAMPIKEIIDDAKRYYGYFALLTNETMDAKTALELYRAKDVVEKAFGNLKERLCFRRTLVSSEQSLDGKMFVEFIALIYLSYINKQMQENLLYKQFSMYEILDKLDIIECFENPGKRLRIGEITEKQREIYVKLGVNPPTG